MASLYGFFGLLKKLAILILILAVAIPLRYGSTNRHYLSLRLFHSMLSLKHSLLPDRARPTLSADYRAFEDVLRMKPLVQDGKLEDLLTVVTRMRSTSSMSNIIPKPSQCKINKEVFEHDGHTVDTYWVDNHHNKFQRHADNIILYIHGGAYILGDIESYAGIECHFSELFNISILHVEYRLSPEHPLPAAVEDTVAIYRALLRHNIFPSQLIVMGDSAGGGLTLLTIQALLAHQLPVPRGAIVLSPWTDISSSGESYTRNRHTDVMLRTHDNSWIQALVLGSNPSQLSSDNSIISPLFGSFKGFPPMYISVGTAELLEDDSRRVAKKAQDEGVDVTFEAGLHMMHVYPAFFPYYPEARKALDDINKWIQTIFDQKPSK